MTTYIPVTDGGVIEVDEHGRWVPLTAAMRQAGRGVDHTEFFQMIFERWPHYVHYRGGRPHYCPPDTFGFIGQYGPSHCDWIVPGTI